MESCGGAWLAFFLEPATVWERWRYFAENFSPHSGGSFELIHPAFLVLAALASALTLASARKRGLPWYATLFWTIGSLICPQVFAPLYVAFLLWFSPQTPATRPPYRFLLPALYLCICLGWLGWRSYRAYYTLDAHLARANQYRISNWHQLAANELRAALAFEDSAHVRNLLGNELAAAGNWEESLQEFYLAGKLGDNSAELLFNQGNALWRLERKDEAKQVYEKFRQRACDSLPPTDSFDCRAAQERVKPFIGE
jgi:hypothetical protein